MGVFHARLLLRRCFQGFFLPVLEYCFPVWCSAVDIHHVVSRVVSGACFLTEGVLECDIAHRQSVSALCMLYKIRCNPMRSLYGALPGPYAPVHVTRGALAHRYPYALHRCRTSQYSLTFIPMSASLWNDLRWCGTCGFQEQGQCLFIYLSSHSFFVSYCLPSLFLHYMLVLWCWGLRTDSVVIALSQPCIANIFNNN